MQNSPLPYKTYLAFTTGATTLPKCETTSVKIRDTPGVFVSKKKAQAKAERSKRIELLSEAALLEEAQTSDDEEETQQDEYVHTPEDYVPTDDETNDVDDEEYDRINKEMGRTEYLLKSRLEVGREGVGGGGGDREGTGSVCMTLRTARNISRSSRDELWGGDHNQGAGDNIAWEIF
ncbi:hypothetical protein Tco_0248458 [Tanacetum coccineum]